MVLKVTFYLFMRSDNIYGFFFLIAYLFNFEQLLIIFLFIETETMIRLFRVISIEKVKRKKNVLIFVK